MYWSTRSRKFHGKTDTDYVVVKHPLRILGEAWVNGLKFVGGYTVVERNSKVHRMLKKNPVFKKAQEFELPFLRKVGFRTRDIEVIFGKDIFYNYLEAVGLGPDLKPLPVPAEEPALEEPKEIESAELSTTSEVELPAEIPAPEPKEEVLSPIIEVKDESPADEIVTEEVQNQVEELPELTPEEVAAAFQLEGKCHAIKKNGQPCGHEASKASPGGFCFRHLRNDQSLQNN